jgi:hypothetical protein
MEASSLPIPAPRDKFHEKINASKNGNKKKELNKMDS